MKNPVSLPFGRTLPFLPTFLLVACLMMADLCVGQICPTGYEILLFEDFEACTDPSSMLFSSTTSGGQNFDWKFDGNVISDAFSPGEAQGSCWARYEEEDGSTINNRTATVASIPIDVSAYKNIQVSLYYGYDDQANNPTDEVKFWIFNPVTGDRLYYRGFSDTWHLNGSNNWLASADAGEVVKTFQIPESITDGNTGLQVFMSFDDGGGTGRGFGFDNFQICGEPACTLELGAVSSIPCEDPGNVSVELTGLGEAPYSIAIGTAIYAATLNGTTLTTSGGVPSGTYSEITVYDNVCTVVGQGVTVTPPLELRNNNGVTAVSAETCGANGQLIVDLRSLATGTAPYTIFVTNANGTQNFLFNTPDPFVIDLPAGSYTTVAIFDANNCTDSQTGTWEISEPTPPQFRMMDGIIFGDAETCGEPATLTVDLVTGSIGTPPYSITLNNSIVIDNILGPEPFTIDVPGMSYNSVQITDNNNCSDTRAGNWTVSDSPLIEFVNVTGVQFNNPTQCGEGGSLDINIRTIVPGTPPFEISLNGGPFSGSYATEPFTINDIPLGNYTSVTVRDDKGCTDTWTGNVTLMEPQFAANVAMVNPTCENNNGVLNANVTTGGGNYSFQWNDTNNSTTQTITSLAPGTYTVTVTDLVTNCNAVLTATLTNQGTPVSITSFTTTDPTGCDPIGTATVNHTTGNNVNYLWSDGQISQTATGLSPGAYTLTVINNADGVSCATIGTTTISSPPDGVTANTTGVTILPVTCPGGNDGGIAGIIISGGTPPYSYEWTLNGNFIANTLDISTVGAGTYQLFITDDEDCSFVTNQMIEAPATFGAVFQNTNVECNGDPSGEIDLTVSGGTAPYTYFWGANNGTTEDLTGLTAGVYTVTVTDDLGCIFTSQTIIASNSELAAFVDLVDGPDCNGGTDGAATITTTGGVTPYTYNWDNGHITASATGLTGGLHLVTVTDGEGCIIIETVVIPEPEQVSASTIAIENATCLGASDGAATIATAGGSGIYTYLWPTGQTSAAETNLDAGTYIITITDSKACVGTHSLTIGEDNPVVLSETIDPVRCNGENNGQITITTAGSYSYTWSTGNNTNTISNLPAGNYSVTVEDNNTNCKAEKNYTVEEPDILVPTADNPEFLCDESAVPVTAAATGGNGGYQYLWSDTGSSTTPTINVNVNQAYTVSVNDAKGCEAAYSFAINSLAAPAVISAAPSFTIVDGEALALNLDDYFDVDAAYDWAIIKENQGTNPATFTTSSGSTDDLLTQLFTLSGQNKDYRVGELTIEISSYLEDGSYRCEGERLTIYIKIIPNSTTGLFLPEIITPNGDGYNDNFEILFAEEQDAKFYYYEIFNRNGARVFRSEIGNERWDGGNNPDGIYYYRLYSTNESGKVVAKGALTILSS